PRLPENGRFEAMAFLFKHLRAFVVGFFTLVVIPVLTTLVIDDLKERNSYHPGTVLDPLLSIVHGVGASPWVRGAALALAGLLVGVWLDMVRRRREKPSVEAQSELLDAQLPPEERRSTLKLRLRETRTSAEVNERALRADLDRERERNADLETAVKTLRGANPDAGVRTLDWGRIAEWSNGDLKVAGHAVAAEMRAFEAHHLEQFRLRRSRRQSLSSTASETAKQWRTQEIAREESETHAALDRAFRTQFLSRATAVRRECFARIGLPQEPTPSSPYFSTALDVHLLAGTNPVTEAAEQIETLTGLLP
ncbi:MAG: hypothetical protein ACYC3L_13485, partial [Gemmatimonadaceae bacterium]